MSDQSLADAPVAADQSSPDAGNTVTLEFGEITPGLPSVADAALTAALQSAKAGGDATHNFFHALNDTALFWDQLAVGTITFAEAISPENELVIIASSGNVDLRLACAYAGGTFTVQAGQPAPVIGTLTVSLGIKSLDITQMTAMTLAVTSLPAGTVIDRTLFTQLLPTVYLIVEGILQAMAASIAEQTQVEDPVISPVGTAGTVLAIASSKTVLLTGAIARGLAIKFMQISSTAVAFSYAAVGALAAVPALLKVLAHDMTASILVYNLTGQPLVFSLQDIEHGHVTLEPGTGDLPGTQTLVDPLGSGVNYPVDYSLNTQLTNNNGLSAIGLVLALGPDGAGQARGVINIPNSGANTMWIGASDADAGTLWAQHSLPPNGPLTTSVTIGSTLYTLATNALSGKTDGAYFYSFLLIAEPA